MENRQADILFKDDQFYVRGHLTLANVMSIYAKSLPDLSKNPELRFDFSQLQSSDSAGLALIIEWIKFAKQQRKRIHFIHLSDDIMSIAKVAGIDNLIHDASKNII